MVTPQIKYEATGVVDEDRLHLKIGRPIKIIIDFTDKTYYTNAHTSCIC